MDDKETEKSGMGLPTAAMIVIGIVGGLVSGASFEIIKYWPQPVSVVPYFGFSGGLLWGLVVGGISGLILGYCTDDNHFADVE